ncbi:TatD family hydrolase [Seleniivibrio sp.]|uniref:TatD family hydrolase n=1 Tax=Seleniivibrio sp. TaxID=2898801 RepID=UPI0025DE5B98|nr:TatD family hydrolase [Seleniivibrio sp.]MCD8553557.1 TatD family hydrolase [Seleniivibrio sp.]
MINKKGSPLHHQFLMELKSAGEAGAFFTDSHAHIHMEPLAEDMEGVISRADENYVRRIVTIGCGLEDSLLAQKAAASHERVFFAAGIHPHDSSSYDFSEAYDDSDVTKGFHKLFTYPKCIAIGEIGLDYFYDLSPRDVQQKVFRHFLQLAKEYKKPVVIHNRDSAEDCVRILDEEVRGRDRNGIIHCFSGDIQLLRWALDNGFYISYAGPVTYSKSDDLRATLQYVPVDRLLTETDSPYLSPMPLRGKTNEPANTVYNAYEISIIKSMNLYEFAVQLEKNYNTLFQA